MFGVVGNSDLDSVHVHLKGVPIRGDGHRLATVTQFRSLGDDCFLSIGSVDNEVQLCIGVDGSGLDRPSESHLVGVVEVESTEVNFDSVACRENQIPIGDLHDGGIGRGEMCLVQSHEPISRAQIRAFGLEGEANVDTLGSGMSHARHLAEDSTLNHLRSGSGVGGSRLVRAIHVHLSEFAEYDISDFASRCTEDFFRYFSHVFGY